MTRMNPSSFCLIGLYDLTSREYKDIYPYMTPATKKHQQLILLDPEKAAMLDELAAETRIAKQVLLREAVDDLLTKHGKLKKAQKLKK